MNDSIPARFAGSGAARRVNLRRRPRARSRADLDVNRRSRPRARLRAYRERGFSLIELMVAMSIFSLVGIGIVTLLARASDFSRSGTSTTEILDSLQTFTDTFSKDAATIYSRADAEDGAPDVRFWTDVVRCDVDADQKPDATIRRLMLVRMIPDETASPVTRSAGSALNATKYVDQQADIEEAAAGKLRATGGLMEVFWTAAPASKDDLAVMTLYRGVRSPVGGAGSLFPSKRASDPMAKGPEERGPVHADEIRRVARPVLGGVLYFGVECWSRHTTTWDPAMPAPRGPVAVWDSTRGILPRGDGKDGESFVFQTDYGSLGRPSLADPTDDTWPRRLRVTLVVEESGQAARTGILQDTLPPDGRTILVSDTRFIPGTDTTQRFVKIGAEWIQFESVDGNRLTGCKRGVRGTLATAHEVGSRVHHGRTVVREIEIAAYRDVYTGNELTARTGR